MLILFVRVSDVDDELLRKVKCLLFILLHRTYYVYEARSKTSAT